MIRFPEAVEVALEELMPNRLTDYLYDLSDKFNSFYTECKVSSTLCLGFDPEAALSIPLQQVSTNMHCRVNAFQSKLTSSRRGRCHTLSVVSNAGCRRQATELTLASL